MVLRSIPLVLNQAGKRLIKINNGRPEVNPVKIQMSIFFVNKLRQIIDEFDINLITDLPNYIKQGRQINLDI